MEKFNRSNVNNPNVSAQDMPKSGFDLSYKTYQDFVLGMLHPTGYQYIMPGDKFSGSADILYTFNQLNTPEISDVEVSQHNFYVPFRALDTTFEEAMVPTELNAMSASWRVPQFTLAALVDIFTDGDAGGTYYTINDFIRDGNAASKTAVEGYVRVAMENTLKVGAAQVFNPAYEVIRQYQSSILNTLPASVTPNADNVYIILTALLEPLIGRGSLLDLLGYNYLRSYDIRKIADAIYNSSLTPQFNKVSDYVQSIPQCEYALRAYYAIWYEHYRDQFLQKRTADLPNWRKFGSTSLLTSGNSNELAALLLPRFRNWTKDMFVGSMPDDISRHVYAPINAASDSYVSVLSGKEQYIEAENDYHQYGAEGHGYVNAAIQYLSYLDPVTGQSTQLACPIPKAVNDSLATISSPLYDPDTLGLDLRDLRKAQMLERYLKRNFYFGDEYQDRMLAHYGAKVSDNSIRRPHLLSSSISSVNPRQEIANQDNGVVTAGTRRATAQDSAHGDAYEFFAEEFGIVISLVSIMPRAQYAGICPQVLMAQQTDFPIPEFAANNDEFGRVMEVAQSGYLDPQQFANNEIFQFYQFGHYPYAHAWRSRVDEVHGSFLDDRADYTFRRFFGLNSQDLVPKLNSDFIVCLCNLGMFYSQVRLDGQGYMKIDNHFYVERVLPTPVEEI